MKFFIFFLCNLSLINAYNDINFTDNINYNNELVLKTNLLQNYTPDLIPIYNNSVDLQLGIALRAFNNINQIDGTITSNIWLRYKWTDPYLKWNSTETNISSIIFNTSPDYGNHIWTPDIYLYNTAEMPMSNLDMTKCIVYSDGTVLWSRPGLITSTCTFNLEKFPYDEQDCCFKFGSWAYHSGQMNLSKGEPDIDLSNYQINDAWNIISYNSQINEKNYLCCPEKYQTINFNFKIRRNPGYYNLNIIIPTFATATLMIMSLMVPWDSGERISFSITVMLSIIVFLLILSENLPKSDNKPLLSIMLIGLIFFSLFVVFFTVIISYMHSFTENKSKTALKIVKFLKKYKCIKCKPQTQNQNQNTLENNRTDSYNNVINNNVEEDCKQVANFMENVFTIIFLLAFIIYCIVVFSLRPNY